MPSRKQLIHSSLMVSLIAVGTCVLLAWTQTTSQATVHVIPLGSDGSDTYLTTTSWQGTWTLHIVGRSANAATPAQCSRPWWAAAPWLLRKKS